eukprot:CAMPEP_0113328820 /NCGR_PEP_ID=MMETSP0010_2-20120614/20346_1 /TAXON_ID=216773 ORGANISM="Corethron hystrix, Strain 308" /NCGR_SAMPLE_ID=MMETSP0010_2 /ASSEMBLY_ACC=CAM_ASM_000155 /LENGTH=248 /DNA_ID=CAMNT_0000190419 /DNA_START=244 /DNA_END=990 /DNA_ORIENTATION=- /assembly_acc=CAM_ASM_000155
MGILVSKLFSSLFRRKEVRILILGLDNAGKTTILYRLQNESDEAIQTIPTIGFNVETLQYKNIKFQVWDLGGQTSIRPYWRCYYPNTDAIIFVVDSADTERMGIARGELSAMLEEDELKESILLVFEFQVWDLGGQTSIRPYWRCYYPNTDAIIFVVDSADTERMGIARGELSAMLEEDELKESILLVFANKQDQKGALNAQQVSDAMGLPDIRNRQWSIQETSALKGKGLFEGFDWLVTCIKGNEEG